MNKNSEERGYQSLMKDALLELQVLRAKLDAQERAKSEPIAIIGMSCLFPGGADKPEAFWQLLHNGVDAITEVPSDRWDIEAYYDPAPDAPGKMYTRYGGFVDQLQEFDAQFFGISPREVLSLDPQHRLLLEVAWHALENAGLAPDQLMGSQTGVFIGICTDDYSKLLLSADPGEIDAYMGTGNAHSTASGRLSYFFGFQGPSLSVDTACSSSLVALHLACQSLRNGECDLALVGGVNRILAPEFTINFSKARMLAPDGRCKTFDAAADGYSRSEGSGAIILRRFSDALDNHDTILTLIRGTAVGQDGRSSGLTVPNGPSQQTVIRKALENARVEPAEVSYVEAHGTGTSLGDPIELRTLGEVFGKSHTQTRPLLIGSVKTNLGHLEAAAGIAGIIKVVMALQYKEIPPHLHFYQPMPLFPWDQYPLEVPTAPRSWVVEEEKKRIAGVSGFGFSGTNVHVVLEEAPIIEPETSKIDRSLHVLTLSAKTQQALLNLTKDYKEYLSTTEDRVADICYTANVGRTHFEYRAAIIGRSKEEILLKLTNRFDKGQSLRASQTSPKDVTFLFTGQGSQYSGMGRELYESAPVFRTALEHCDELFQKELGQSLIESLYAPDAQEAVLNQPIYAQSAIFSIEYALSELWQSYGVRPSLLIGHSIGEYAAACCAGIFTLADAVKLVAARASLMQSVTEEGQMVGILASEATVEQFLSDYQNMVSIAAVNTLENVTISGTQAAIAQILREIKKARIFIEPLPISHAYHSVVMEPYIKKFRAEAPELTFRKPSIPIISSVTGKQINGEMEDMEYWSWHIRQKVRFYEALQTAAAKGCRRFLEIGGTATLTGLAGQGIAEEDVLFLPSLRKDTNAWQQLLTSLTELYEHGVAVDWGNFNRPYPRRKVVLPNYPFQREPYWFKNSGKNYYEMIHSLNWKEKPLELKPQPDERNMRAYIIFMDQQGFGKRLLKLLTLTDATCFSILKATDTAEQAHTLSGNSFDINPLDREQFVTVFEAIKFQAFKKIHLIYLWGMDTIHPAELTTEILQAEQHTIFAGLLQIVQTLVELQLTEISKLTVMTKNAVQTATPQLSVSQSTLWGLGRTIGIEHSDLWNKLLDVDDDSITHNLEEILQEIESNNEDQISFKQGKRYVIRLEKMARAQLKSENYQMREDSTYLITGGLGALGLFTAEWMIEKGARSLVLMSRSAPKPQAQQTLQKLQAQGARVVVGQGDVSNFQDLSMVFETIKTTMPPLRGIIHGAGVLGLGMLINETWKQVEKIFTAKVAGTWNLHKLTETMPLDFFIMFSSIASIGSIGQSVYGAANMFLNALAEYRRNLNLPALSICWQTWNIGMTTSEEVDLNQLTAIGFNHTQTSDGGNLLNVLLGSSESELYVFDVDWNKYSEYFSAKQRRGILSEVCQSFSERQEAENSQFIAALKNAASENRDEILLEYLRKLTATVMGHDDYGKVVVDQALMTQGVDSLMSVQIRNRLRKLFNADFPATLLFKYPTLEQVSNHILSDVLTFGPQSAMKEIRTQSVLDKIDALLEMNS